LTNLSIFVNKLISEIKGVVDVETISEGAKATAKIVLAQLRRGLLKLEAETSTF